jgi:hypothetical protein
MVAICRICDLELKTANRATTSLWSHLKGFHRPSYMEAIKTKKLMGKVIGKTIKRRGNNLVANP